jgi:ABC-2 type transport system permease protein
MSGLVLDMVSDLGHIWLSLKFEIRKHWKRNRLIITGLLALLLPLLFYIVPLATGTEFPSSADIYASINLSFLSLLIVICAAIFAGDSIAGETEKRTSLMLYSAPQRRNSIFIGKYLAALLATSATVGLYYLITMIEIGAIYGFAEVSINFLKSFLLAILYSSAVVSVVYFLSSLMNRAIVATLLGFFSMMLILPIISNVLSMVDMDPWFMLTHSADLITDVLGQSLNRNFGPGGANPPGMIGTFNPEFYTGTLVMTFYSVFFFIAGVVNANLKRME